MNRSSVFLAFLMSLSSIAANRSANVDIIGMGPGVDGAAYQVVLSVLGKAVADGKLDLFKVYGHGFEGGASMCVQLSRFSEDEELVRLVAQLKTIKAGTGTAYTIEPKEKCE